MAQNDNIIPMNFDADFYKKMGNQKLQQQEYKKAAEYFGKVLEMSPQDFDVTVNYALCPPFYLSLWFTICNGLPYANALLGISLVTIQPAPTFTLEPIVTPGKTVTLAPIIVLLPI